MKCPQCNFGLSKSAKECPQCGMEMAAARKIEHFEREPHRCYYMNHGLQCPAVGCMSPDVGSGEQDKAKKVKPPRMFCEPHFWALQVGDLKKAELILDDYLSHGVPKPPLNWLEKFHRELDTQYGPSKSLYSTVRVPMPPQIREQIKGWLGQFNVSIPEREPGEDG